MLSALDYAKNPTTFARASSESVEHEMNSFHVYMTVEDTSLQTVILKSLPNFL